MGLAILPNYVGQFLKKLTIEKLVCFLLSYFSFISMAYSISVPFSVLRYQRTTPSDQSHIE